MNEPDQRAANLPGIALASAVALVLALPLAFATAGPGPVRPDGTGVPTAPSEGERPTEDAAPSAGRTEGSGAPGDPDGAATGPATSCGPELTAPEGVWGQTCVLTEGRHTWARTRVRNETEPPLSVVLTLRHPDGRTTRARCPVPASGEPVWCETPRRPTAALAGGSSYSAVAEVAHRDGDRLLLRAGSSPAGPSTDE